ncbi:dehydratase [Microvirga sp. KLBC 81]|uniref:MaoC family dehydratase n=1 Tax=Microvirga sp. KLBC 81 TaxID=1862707 RepID=UPI000D524687|nr:MaoC/PaaZ C-terminal domain-containing protein [Microvirga sp. KLBC 81]PVE24939.1 dehydratase [Microvirga sp. KLBC 81]
MNGTAFEDYAIGFERESFARTVTEADIVAHAGQTGDFFPHHVDEEFARTTPFGGRIAHGTLILSIGIGLLAREINPLSFSYGYDRLRFVRPVRIGDTIRARATVVAKQEDPKRMDHGRVIERCEVINQRDEVVVVADHIRMVRRRNAVDSDRTTTEESVLPA